ncbi:hypothetical protein K435DRAFT_829379 [Dendrothele bispora CBS 962.96]|uniref:Large ribosomal subunit protein mL54 n=1 Tax=Dendrothele bispora (strain CBS 962.96) TaxID=1314807 RepID=A0A4S8LXG7_DENBC|nr:hypothetical protein K435DRAFT_829379 [Dendrothele bispora CBS 962.96]
MFLSQSLRHARRQAWVVCRARTYATKETPEPSSSKNATATTPKSCCSADTVLEGLNYLKGQPPVLAKPDEEYPDWLWTVTKPKVIPDDGPGGKLERYNRRLENKQRIKERNFMQTQ